MTKHGKQMWFGGEAIWVPERARFIRKDPDETKIRPCLKCGKPMKSYTRCHRICDYCHACNGFEYQPYVVVLNGTKVERRF